MQSQLVPLAITIAEDGYGCIAAVDENHRWIRPEPVLASDVSAADTPYRYFIRIRAEIGEPEVEDPRIEDRSLRGRPDVMGPLGPAERADLLRRILDSDVEHAYSGQRTVGLIRAHIERIYAWEWARQSFLRAVFCDASGARHDWLVPDYQFGQVCWGEGGEASTTPRNAERLLKILKASETFFAVSLTRPVKRFPGRIRGCHPLVVGVHSEPDYLAVLRGLTE